MPFSHGILWPLPNKASKPHWDVRVIVFHVLWLDKQRPREMKGWLLPTLPEWARGEAGARKPPLFSCVAFPSPAVLPGKSPAALGYLPVTVTWGLSRRNGTVWPITHVPAAKGPLTGTEKTAHVNWQTICSTPAGNFLWLRTDTQDSQRRLLPCQRNCTTWG